MTEITTDVLGYKTQTELVSQREETPAVNSFSDALYKKTNVWTARGIRLKPNTGQVGGSQNCKTYLSHGVFWVRLCMCCYFMNSQTKETLKSHEIQRAHNI